MFDLFQGYHEFPFPSNGKAYPKWWEPPKQHRKRKKCFHSLQTGKCIARLNKQLPIELLNCFYSLQTGKRITRITQKTILNSPMLFPFPSNGKAYHKFGNQGCEIVAVPEFPFPSNGNAHHKSKKTLLLDILIMCFHSLQTGKHIARRKHKSNSVRK